MRLLNSKDYVASLVRGTTLGVDARSYTVEKLTSDSIYLRGPIEGRRGSQEFEVGSLRVIPRDLVETILQAILDQRIKPDDILRKNRKDKRSLLDELKIDHDPFIMGYDSTIFKICLHLLDNKSNVLVNNFDGGIAENKEIGAVIFPKPFLIYAGLSGTGKTREMRKMAFESCPAELQSNPTRPGNYSLIPVKPNWHDSTELLGYTSRIGIASGKPAEYVSTDFIQALFKAWLFPMTPYFVCLDEMNLAPVEQYFAEYLSILETRRFKPWTELAPTYQAYLTKACGALPALYTNGLVVSDPILSWSNWDDAVRDPFLAKLRESLAKESADLQSRFDALCAILNKDQGIMLPPNLIVVGTVNMDETTHSFSRKVLDRAMTTEMNEVDLAAGLDDISPLAYSSTPAPIENFIGTMTIGSQAKEQLEFKQAGLTDTIVAHLNSINNVLDGTPFKFAYRTRDEALIYSAYSLGVSPTVADIAKALDSVVMMKILPRIEGDMERLHVKALIQESREALPTEASEATDTLLQNLWFTMQDVLGSEWSASKSRAKLEFMLRRLSNTGYTSFWP